MDLLWYLASHANPHTLLCSAKNVCHRCCRFLRVLFSGWDGWGWFFFRTFKTKTIVFFDTKVLAHRLNIVLGIAGIRAAELHGNLAMTQRLEALDR